MSNVELEALVGHLFIVGGRSISTASPGAIAVPPPRRTARGRDIDTLFGLITLSTEHHQPASFYEELTRQISGTYFSASGSVTSALRQAIGVANHALYATNRGSASSLTVGLSCAILREQEVYVAVVGQARCFLMREGFVERLPPEEEFQDSGPGLGGEAEPYMRFYRREIRAGDFLILADNSLNHLHDATLLHAIESGDVDTALNNLASVAGQFSSAEVIKFVAPLEEGEADTVPSAPKRKPILTPPRLPSFGASSPSAPVADAAADAPLMGSEKAGEPPTQVAAQQKAGPVLRQMRHNTAIGLAKAAGSVRVLLEKVLPDESGEEEPSRLHLSPTLQFGVAVSVAVIVALLTTAVYRWRGQTTQYAQLVREAQREIEAARAAGTNQAEARPHWDAAVFLLDQASQLRSPSEEISALREEALAVLDSYDYVTRVTPILLRTYEPGAVLRGPMMQGVNIYLIDTTQDILYREDLDQTGTRILNASPQIVTRQGELIGNQVVGGLIDLEWMEEGGVPQRNVLAVLSRNGLLITYSPSSGVAAVLLPGFEAWQDPRAIAVYERALYILDAGANEIWRYEARSDGYTNAPQRYFTDVLPDLTDAIDMEFDTNGNVYVLHADGEITKYAFGRPQTFQFAGFPQPISRPTALYLNLSPYDRTLFIADPGWGSLYACALTGAFLSNYKDTEDTLLDYLSGVFYQDRPPYVYITAGNQLYYFPRP